MSVLTQRLNRKNAAGSYDTVYLETTSTMVLRPSGATVEAALSAVETTAGNAVPKTRKVNGKALSADIDIGAGDITAGTLAIARGGTGGGTAAAAVHGLVSGSTALAATEVAKDDTLALDDASAGTGKKITAVNFLKWSRNLSYYQLGNVVHWATFDWVVFHVDYDTGYVTLGLKDSFCRCRFSQDDDPDGSETCNIYAHSKLLSDCVVPFQTMLYGGSSGSNSGILYGHVEQLVRMDDIEGVGGADDPMYVFIPTYDMMMNQFDLSKINRYSGWTNWGSHGNRIARAGANTFDGTTHDAFDETIYPTLHNTYAWWLSTPTTYQGSPRVCFVGNNGNINGGNNYWSVPSYVYGFRPFVRIRA